MALICVRLVVNYTTCLATRFMKHSSKVSFFGIAYLTVDEQQKLLGENLSQLKK